MLKKIDSINEGEFLYETTKTNLFGINRKTFEVVNYTRTVTGELQIGEGRSFSSFGEATHFLLKTYG